MSIRKAPPELTEEVLYLVLHFEELKKEIKKRQHSIPTLLETEYYKEALLEELKRHLMSALNKNYDELEITDDILNETIGIGWHNN